MKRISFKILFIVLTVVLVGAAGLVIALTSNIAEATATRDIQTAVAESAGKEASEASPAASPVYAEMLRWIVQEREMRRDFIIPSVDSTVLPEAKTWESIEPDNFVELKYRAISKTNELSERLFGHSITDADIVFRYYTDTSKHRADFVKVVTMDSAIVCTLAADTLDLIEIDYYFIPEKEQISELGVITDGDRRIADKVAASFGTDVLHIRPYGGGWSDKYGYGTKTFNLTMENGKLVKIGTLNDELYAVGVFPTQACITESVYFVADIQRDPSIVHLACPRNFVLGEPGEGDMTKDEALSIYNKFLNLANGTGIYPDPEATFYVDKSGARENYWHLKGEKLTLDIASRSKWLVYLKCNGLWNPDKNLTEIPYGSMGGSAYEVYVRNIMKGIYGDSLVRVEPNAVYDGHYCTEDAIMADGSWYEFYFKDGKLMQVYYFYNLDCYEIGPSGWKADNTYINTVTGEEFIPQ